MLSCHHFSLASKKVPLKGFKMGRPTPGCNAVFLPSRSLSLDVLNWTKPIATKGETIVAVPLGELHETQMLFYGTDGRVIAASALHMSTHPGACGQKVLLHVILPTTLCLSLLKAVCFICTASLSREVLTLYTYITAVSSSTDYQKQGAVFYFITLRCSFSFLIYPK